MAKSKKLEVSLADGRSINLMGVENDANAVTIEIDRVVRDELQPREEFDEVALEHLADSIKQRGQLQPIVARWDASAGKYVVVAGERRLRACRLAGCKTIRAVVCDGDRSPSQILEDQLVENLLREDLRPIEQARAFRRLLDAGTVSLTKLGAKLGVDKSVISRALALLELPEEVQAKVEDGQLAAASAYEITKLKDPEAQTSMATSAVREKKTRKQVTDEVREAAPESGRPSARADVKAGNTPAKTFYLDDDVTVVVKFKGEAKDTVVNYLKRALKVAQKGEAPAA